jgi:hypothetical protein
MLVVVWCAACANPSTVTVGPFDNLQDAQKAARFVQNQGLTGPLVVKVSGNTTVSQPIVFSASDSGTPSSPITYVADGDGATISGGRNITGWYLVGNQVWAAKVGAASFRQLFVNGVRMTPARTPNEGYFNVNGSVNYNNPVSFSYRAGQMSSNWVGAQIVLLQAWGESRLPITSVDPETQTVTLANQLLPWMIETNARYWVENSAEFLDQPGEWFLDGNAGIVYYYASASEDVNQDTVIVPATDTLLLLNGVHDITFKGFVFEYSDWTLPQTGYRDMQTAFDIPAAVTGSGISRVTISNSQFTHLGTWAVNIDTGSSNNIISGNEMSDLGAGGVKAGETCTDSIDNPNAKLAGFADCTSTMPVSAWNKITSNTVHDIGMVYLAAAGIWLGQTHNNSVCSNEVFNTNQTAISVGWTWGYGLTAAHHNLIAFNKIHSIGRGMLSDLGGIYTLGTQPGTIIRNNLIHDVTGHLYGGWGIYEDNGSSEISIENNIVYLAHSGGFIHNSKGNGNQVINNIFALGDNGQLIYSDSPPPQTPPSDGYNVLFERNILYGDVLLSASNLRDSYFRFDGSNLFFNPDALGDVGVADGIVANPLFVSPKSGDFSLAPNSPAYGLGFKPIQLTPKSGPCN